MISIDEIYKIIENEEIIYEETDLKNMHSKGIYFKVDEMAPIIAIDSSIVKHNKVYISILSEELGHHFTTQGNLLKLSNSYSEKILRDKYEVTAKKWAANLLINDYDFVQALLTCISNKYDMCEHFNITYELLEKKINSIVCDELLYMKIKELFQLYEVQYNSCNI